MSTEIVTITYKGTEVEVPMEMWDAMADGEIKGYTFCQIVHTKARLQEEAG